MVIPSTAVVPQANRKFTATNVLNFMVVEARGMTNFPAFTTWSSCLWSKQLRERGVLGLEPCGAPLVDSIT